MKLKAEYADGRMIDSTNVATDRDWSSYASAFDVVTLSKDSQNNWANIWSDLPRYAPGQEGKLVTYTVEELEDSNPLGYHLTDSSNGGGTAEPNARNSQTLTNTYVPIDIPIKKIWVDDDDRDGLRPASVSFTLSATVDGNDISDRLSYMDGHQLTSDDLTKSLSTSDADSGDTNTWANDGWQNLPRYYNGKEIVYTVTEEDLAGDAQGRYTVSDTASAITAATDDEPMQDLRTITNTHEIYLTQLTFDKTWVDKNNQDDKRPTAVDFANDNVHLTAQLAGSTVELKVGGAKQGKADTYAVVYDDDGNPSTAMVPFEGAEVTIQGSNGSDNTGASYNTYTITYKDLPRYRDVGTEIIYTFTEGQVSYYHRVANASDKQALPLDTPIDITTDAADPTDPQHCDNTGIASVINKYDPEHIDLTVTKSWNHGANTVTTPPTTATVKLVATSATDRVDTAEAWSDRGYDFEPVQTLVGSYVEGDETTYGAKCSWVGLPKHMPGKVGEEITYSVEEVDVPDGYRVEYTPLPTGGLQDKSQQAIAVTNIYEDVKLTATKVWDDANNQDGMRKPVKFKLQSRVGTTGAFTDVDGAPMQQVPITNSQPVVWENLLAWKNNQRVYYRVVEVPDTAEDDVTLEDYLVGYTTTYGSFAYPENPTISGDNDEMRTYEIKDHNGDGNATITNTHTTQTYTEAEPLTFRKSWDHKGVVYDYPDQLLDKLHLWQRIEGSGDTPTLVADSVWKTHATVGNDLVVTITNLPRYMPQSSEVSVGQKLEYFISEDEATYYSMTTTADLEVNGSKLLRLASDAAPVSGVVMKNTRKAGSLQISKTVDSALAADHNTNFLFTITTTPVLTGQTASYTYEITNDLAGAVSTGTVTFTNGQSDAITLKSGQTATVAGLPAGVTYTVVETANNDFTTTINPQNAQQALTTEGDARQLAFANARKLGTLNVSKTIVSAVNADASKDFTFQVSLGGLTATPNPKTFSGVTFSRDEVSGMFVGEFTLHSGQTQTFDDLPTGATYIVTELDDANYTTVSQGTAGTISSTSSNSAFTNTRKTGSLKLTKNVTSPFASEQSAYYPFTVHLNMPATAGQTAEGISHTFDATGVEGSKVTFTDGVATVNVRGNTPVVISGLPVDAVYSVEEGTVPSVFVKGEPEYTCVASGGTTSADTRTTHDIDENVTYGVEIANVRDALPVSLYKISSLTKEGVGGAEFILSIPDGQTAPADWVDKQLVSVDGTGCLVEKANQGTLTKQEFVLVPGTYQLTEIVAPDGYNTLTQPATFTITEKREIDYRDSILENDPCVVDMVTGDHATDASHRYGIIRIANSTGFELPSTGGPGTQTFTLAGALLVAIAAAALTIRRRTA